MRIFTTLAFLCFHGNNKSDVEKLTLGGRSHSIMSLPRKASKFRKEGGWLEKIENF